MALSLQQSIRYRKLIYTSLIAALFLASLLHRQFVIVPRAEALQLRDVDRGEVELTGSALRLALTGSRGIAVTFLWNDVMKKQEKHRWNEVEMLVNSITELQPHFITPWLFQSWNLAFNVARDNERPRDKYYYVARGLERLAAGERRNSKPGNPDMRYSMGMYLQIKIGTADEKMTMRCLLDLSAMDPVDRDPDQFRSGGRMDERKFYDFCRAYPRLVRRFRDQLGYDDAAIIEFLQDARHVPGRFSADTVPLEGGRKRSKLKDPREQWPVLPPRKPERYLWPLAEWPDAGRAGQIENGPVFGLTDDAFGIYLVTRTWHIYSQETLPAPNPHPHAAPDPKPDPATERLPRRPALLLFRGHPARAQAYMAESLQEEGWFDDQGWFIKGWFKDREFDNLDKRIVGDHLKYHSGLAWDKAFKFYLKHGEESGLYLDRQQRREWEQKAAKYLNDPLARVPLEKRPRDLPQERKEGLFAVDKLSGHRRASDLVNFDPFYTETRAKSTPQGVAALKLFAMAEPFRRKSAPVMLEYYERKDNQEIVEKHVPLLEVYERAVELWLGLMLDSPLLRLQARSQDETYELQTKYLDYFQNEKLEDVLKPVAGGMCQWAVPVNLPPSLIAATVRARNILLDDPAHGVLHRVKKLRGLGGPFELVYTLETLNPRTYQGLDDEAEQKLKMVLVGLSTTGKPWLGLHPSLQPFQLAFAGPRDAPVRGWWRPLLNPQVVSGLRERARPPQQPPTKMPPKKPPR